MIGLSQLAEAAKGALGDAILRKPVRVSCPQCGKFLVRAMSPTFVSVRCAECHTDIVVLVSRKGEVLATSEAK